MGENAKRYTYRAVIEKKGDKETRQVKGDRIPKLERRYTHLRKKRPDRKRRRPKETPFDPCRRPHGEPRPRRRVTHLFLSLSVPRPCLLPRHNRLITPDYVLVFSYVVRLFTGWLCAYQHAQVSRVTVCLPVDEEEETARMVEQNHNVSSLC